MATSATDSQSKINDNPGTRVNEGIPLLAPSTSSDQDCKVPQMLDGTPNMYISRKRSNSKEMKSSHSQDGHKNTDISDSRKGDVEDLSLGIKKIKLEIKSRHNNSGDSHEANSNSIQNAGDNENDPAHLTSPVKSNAKSVTKQDSEEDTCCNSNGSSAIKSDGSSELKNDNERTVMGTRNNMDTKKERDRNSDSSQNISTGGKSESDNNDRDHDTNIRSKWSGGSLVGSLGNAAFDCKNAEIKRDIISNHSDNSNTWSTSTGTDKSPIKCNSMDSSKSSSRKSESRIGDFSCTNNSSRGSLNSDMSSSNCSSAQKSGKGSMGNDSNSGGTDNTKSRNNGTSVSRCHTSNETTGNRTSNPNSSRSSNQNTSNSSTSTGNAELTRNVNRAVLNRDEEQSKRKFENNCQANNKNSTTSSQNSTSREKEEKEKEEEKEDKKEVEYEEEEEEEENEEEVEEENDKNVKCFTKSSSDTTKSFPDQQGRCRGNGAGTSSSNEEYSEWLMVPENVRIQYEWQFKDDHGWTNYAQVPSSMNHSGAKTATSDDIELYYLTDAEKCPLLIEINNVQFILDFQKMTQTNQKTKAQRSIRRTKLDDMHGNSSRWPVSTPNASVNACHSTSNNRATDHRNNYDQQRSSNISQNHSSVKFEWQFENEFGKWVTYGRSNSKIGALKATSSDDIEKVFSDNSSKAIMRIQSNHRQYVLNFQNMTQTNDETQVQRKIRRVRQQSTEKGGLLNSVEVFVKDLMSPVGELSQFEWQFQDEHGAWITFGQTNSAGMSHCATTVTSDDIEKYFNSPPKKLMMTIRSRSNRYVLNFTDMMQINEATSVQRPIRRISKVIRGTEPHYNVGPSSGSAAKFNSASIGPFPTANRSIGGNGFDNGQGTDNIPHGHINYGHGASNIPHGHINYGHGASNIPHGHINYGHGVRQRPHGHINHSNSSANNIPHVWQFQDERGAWITYGQFSTTGNFSGSTSASSADIEEHWRKTKGYQPMKVNSSRGVYLLDFMNMVQMNTATGTKKYIRRIPIQ